MPLNFENIVVGNFLIKIKNSKYIKKGGIEEKLIRNYNCKKVLHENKID